MANELPTLAGYGASDFPGGGFDYYGLDSNQPLFGDPYSSQGGGNGNNLFNNNPLKDIPGLGILFDNDLVSKIFGGLFGGNDKPKLPKWQRLANREFAQGRALLTAYDALYQPTLDMARRSASDYGDLYRRASNEALSHDILAARTKRAAELSDFQTLGPAYVESLRATNPALADFYDRTRQDLSYGTSLSPYERRDVSQAVLEGLNRRGMSLSPSGIYEEAIALGSAGNQRYQQRLANAATGLSLYGDVFQATTGRPALAPAPQGATVAAPDYSGYTNDLFNYGVNREIQGRELNAAQGARRDALIGSTIQGLLGSASSLGAMCWVAREIFGWTDPRWVRFREWLLGWAPDSVVEWYAANGPGVAQQIADQPELRPVWREWMEARIADLDLLEGNAVT